MSSENNLFSEISSLSTEQINPLSKNIDSLPALDILKIINEEDKSVAFAVEKEISHIAKAVEAVVNSFTRNGRLLYFGAGTSGRLGVVDASECPPTFGTDPEMVQGFIAGGKEAMFRAQEGAEDFEENGADDVLRINVTKNDVVCGIAASNRTPYVLGAIKKAKSIGAATIFLSCSPRSSFSFKEADIIICPEVGPEVIMGSTRLKSGTSQKMVLNMITTTSMVLLGKTYENMMIDLQLTNKKLVERAKRIIMLITGCNYAKAAEYLELSGGHVKTAIVMISANTDKDTAQLMIKNAGGFVRKALS
ncbi:MAG: N-acetylmuramic acid 6-phosphate etherase [Ignavibacteria bacterium]|nr:N-acetylmuramic acid 6-phosphate etherase [Ignavibacteria bacterium]